MKVLVIGGAGYIGSHVTRQLLDEGHTVGVYDNLSSGTWQNLFREASFTEGDILDSGSLLAEMKKGWEAVIHLAAFKAAGESMVRPEKYSVNNISGTISILNACMEAGIRSLVFSSSAAVYGEPAYLPVDEKHPTNPENYYGFTKLEIERILDWYDRLKGLKYAALRYFNAAGYDPEGRISGLEKNPGNLIPIMMEAACGMRDRLSVYGNDYPTPDGTGIRDYIHVTDLARAHVLALEYIRSRNESLTVNLGSETGVSVLEILEAARRLTGKAIPAEITARRPGDPAKLVASSGRARQILNWRPLHSDVESLVKSTWAAYSRQR